MRECKAPQLRSRFPFHCSPQGYKPVVRAPMSQPSTGALHSVPLIRGRTALPEVPEKNQHQQHKHLEQIGKSQNNQKARENICEAGQNLKTVVTSTHTIRSSKALHLHPRTQGQ